MQTLKFAISAIVCLVVIVVLLNVSKPALTEKNAGKLIPNGMSISNVYKILGTNAVVSSLGNGKFELIYFFPFLPPPPRVKTKLTGMTVIISNNIVAGRYVSQ